MGVGECVGNCVDLQRLRCRCDSSTQELEVRVHFSRKKVRGSFCKCVRGERRTAGKKKKKPNKLLRFCLMPPRWPGMKARLVATNPHGRFVVDLGFHSASTAWTRMPPSAALPQPSIPSHPSNHPSHPIPSIHPSTHPFIHGNSGALAVRYRNTLILFRNSPCAAV